VLVKVLNLDLLLYQKNNTRRTGIGFLRKENVKMPHAGNFKLKPLHKQENRLPMSRGVNKNNRKQFEQNWDRIFKKGANNAKKKSND
jgi:hypothetical protein